MTGQEKGDIFIQVTTWASLTVYTFKPLLFQTCMSFFLT